jgi:hypothetical protein
MLKTQPVIELVQNVIKLGSDIVTVNIKDIMGFCWFFNYKSVIYRECFVLTLCKFLDLR